MAEPMFASDDDLPRTLRRERDARAREQREREARDREHLLREREAHDRELQQQAQAEPGFGAAGRFDPAPAAWEPPPARDAGVVTRLEIPFLHLMMFSVKAVLAAIPALILLGVLVWVAGKGLATAFPELARMQIFIQFKH